MAAVSQPVIPQWVAPPAHAISDLLVLAAHYGAHGDEHAHGCLDAAGWVTGHYDVTAQDATAELRTALRDKHDRRGAGAAATFAWLFGTAGPPIELPLRGTHGALVTADELYQQRQAADPVPWGPERRREERQRADADAARSERLAHLG